MATTFKGVNKTKADSPTSGNILDGGVLGGRVRVMQDSYICAGTEVTDDVIQMGKALPKGARILDVILHFGACGSGVTLNVGDAEDDNRYISAVDASGAGVVRLEAAEVAGRNYKVDITDEDAPDDQVLIDVNAADTVLTSDAEINLIVLYTID